MPAVTKCKTYTQGQPASGGSRWLCHLALPNSFTANDGVQLEVQGEGETKALASEDACRTAFASLLLTNASEVVLRPAHWKVSIDDLVAGLPHVDPLSQALPVHVAGRNRNAGVDAGNGSYAAVAVAYDEVADLIRKCLHAHGGSFDPAHISHAAMGLAPGDERVYSAFNRLLNPDELRPFIDAHPESVWKPRGRKGMLVTWAQVHV